MRKVWLITGAGRGMGIDFARAALAAGNAVVATGRNPAAVATAVGEAEQLLVVKLDVTSRADAEAAVQAAVERFGRIDVLVNNAANFYGGYFAEYAERHAVRVQWYTDMNGQQAGDPARLARARHHRQPGAGAAPLHRRRRRACDCRAEGAGAAGADRRLSRPVDLART